MASTAARGYGHRHQQLRRWWAARMAGGEVVPCRRCGLPIPADGAWDLGHDDLDRGLPASPEHRWCNRSSATRRRNRGFRRVTLEQRAAEWSRREDEWWQQLARERELAERSKPVPRIY